MTLGASQTPGKFPIVFNAGDDVTITFTVSDGSAYAWTGATVAATIEGHATVTAFTVDKTTDGTLILTLTDTQTTALGANFNGSWFLAVTKSGATRTWLAGQLSTLAQSTPWWYGGGVGCDHDRDRADGDGDDHRRACRCCRCRCPRWRHRGADPRQVVGDGLRDGVGRRLCRWRCRARRRDRRDDHRRRCR